jgi:hypothetical protein
LGLATKDVGASSMTKYKLSMVTLLLASTTMSAHAASITTGQNNNTPTIYITGDIVAGDHKQFAPIAANSFFKRGRVFVYLGSRGGDAEAALAIGEMVRQSGYETVVFDECSSACALIWLAGNKRWASEKANIGFHAIYYADRTPRQAAPGWNAVVGAYLGRLGFSDDAIYTLTDTSPESIFWLTDAKAKALGISATTISKRN